MMRVDQRGRYWRKERELHRTRKEQMKWELELNRRVMESKLKVLRNLQKPRISTESLVIASHGYSLKVEPAGLGAAGAPLENEVKRN